MSVFGVILVRTFPHSSVRMRENTDQNNSEYRHFSVNVGCLKIYFLKKDLAKFSDKCRSRSLFIERGMPKVAVVSQKLCDSCFPGNVESFFRETIVQKPFLTARFESGNFLEKYLMFLLKIGILFFRNFFLISSYYIKKFSFFSKAQC